MQILYTKALSLVDSNFTAKADNEGAFSGYAAATGNVDLGNDMIMKGAFSDWLKTADASRVRVLWNHDWDRPIGKNMAMIEDEKGLEELFEKWEVIVWQPFENDTLLSVANHIDSLARSAQEVADYDE